jgi:hypothetical protein
VIDLAEEALLGTEKNSLHGAVRTYELEVFQIFGSNVHNLSMEDKTGLTARRNCIREIILPGERLSRKPTRINLPFFLVCLSLFLISCLPGK